MRCVEKRNKMQTGEERIYCRKNADGRADQSRVKRLLKNTSTCAQTFPSSSSPLSFFDFFALRDTHTSCRAKFWRSSRAKACPRGKERYYPGTGAKLSHYVLHYDLIHLRKKFLVDNRDPSSLREKMYRGGRIEDNLFK